MVNWQITAATLRCDVVDEEVTLLIHKDWSVKCTGYPKHTRAVSSAIGSSNRNRRGDGCRGPGCPLARDYLKKLQDEESGR
jgi:hypothetical protein